MTPQQRRAKQTTALVALLQALPEDQLKDVIEELGAKGVVVVETPADAPRRVCGTCGHVFPECRRRALATGDDHEFDPINR